MAGIEQQVLERHTANRNASTAQARAPADRIFLLDLPGFTTRYYGKARELGDGAQGLSLGQSDRLLARRVADRTGTTARTPVSEFRRSATLWVSFGAPWVERFRLAVNWTNRSGTVDEVHVSRNELSVNVGGELAP